MDKIQAKSIFRLVPLIGDLGRFLWAFTLKSLVNGISHISGQRSNLSSSCEFPRRRVSLGQP